MKFKNVLMTFGLAAVLGLGVGANLNGGEKKVEMAEAATSETTIYIKVESSTVWNQWTFENSKLKVKLWKGTEGTEDAYIWNHSLAADEGGMGEYYDSVNEVTYFYFSRTFYHEQTAGCVYYDDKGSWAANYTSTFTFEAASAGQNLLTVSGGNNTTPTSPSVAWGTVTISSAKTVTKTAVEFDSKGDATGTTWSLGSELVSSGATYNVPVNPAKLNLEHFEGWYSNAACTTAYTATTINADTEIFAKFTKLSVDSYFYWTNKDSATLTNIYFFGEYAPVAWPGAALSTFKVDDVLYYNGEAKLYKIPCPSSGDFQMVLNSGGDANKTDNLDVEQGKLLYTWDKKTASSGTEWWGSNFVDGSAADLVSRIEVARNAVAASSGILQYSVCGIDPEQARNLYNEYYDMSADNKALINASYTHTYKGSYDGEHTPDEGDVSFSEIMLSLKKVAEDGGYSVKGSASYIFATNASSQYSSTGIIVAIAVATSTLLIGGYFLLKKKKED